MLKEEQIPMSVKMCQEKGKCQKNLKPTQWILW